MWQFADCAPLFGVFIFAIFFRCWKRRQIAIRLMTVLGRLFVEMASWRQPCQPATCKIFVPHPLRNLSIWWKIVFFLRSYQQSYSSGKAGNYKQYKLTVATINCKTRALYHDTDAVDFWERYIILPMLMIRTWQLHSVDSLINFEVRCQPISQYVFAIILEYGL